MGIRLRTLTTWVDLRLELKLLANGTWTRVKQRLKDIADIHRLCNRRD